MIDLHCHILPIDDGAKNIEEAIEMIELAKKSGYNTLCLTSHYKVGKYENEKYNETFKKLEEEVIKRKIKIKLLKGNELYLTLEGIERLEENQVNTMGDSNYILVECFPGMAYNSLKNIIKKIQKLGYRVILAHAERYTFIDMKKLIDLRKNSVVIQVNIKSIKYKKVIIKWISNGLVDILSSDAHDKKYRNYDFEEILLELEKKIGTQIYNKILIENQMKILKNEEIGDVLDEKKSFINNVISDSFLKQFFKNNNSK